MKRLFLFAGYNRDGIVDDSLLYYLNHLSGLGDIVFVMDNDASDDEIKKTKQIPSILYADAVRHGEYDFGSYKRAYTWARDNKLLEKYDWIYLVNDSVLGPLFDLNPILTDLESSGADFTGMVSNCDDIIPPHIQSWFVGLSQRIVTANFFDEFITSVKHQACKDDIVLGYEVRLSRLIIQRGYKVRSLLTHERLNSGVMVYTDPMAALKHGVPFIKKAALSNIKGVRYLIPYIHDTKFFDVIVEYIKHNNIQVSEQRASGRYGYYKTFRLTMFSVPLCTVRTQKIHNVYNYKVYILDKIPVFKISIVKNK